MGTTPVRIPEEEYRELKRFAASLDVTMSEAASLALNEADLDRIAEERVRDDLDPDLNRELTAALLQASSVTDLNGTDSELIRRQMDRNRERSDLIGTEA